jgi:manganese/zinc/iron transport system permease protein
MTDNPLTLLQDPAVRPVALGTALLGAITATVGTFAVIRRQSLQGDVISHAALPGVALAFLLGGRGELLLLLGAGFTGWLAIVLVNLLGRGKIRQDSLLGGTLAVFFGLGLVLLTYLQRQSTSASGIRIQTFLFGHEAANLQTSDLLPVLGLGGLAVGVLLLVWKEFKILSFDADFAASLGFPTQRIDWLLTGLLVLAVVIGLQSVGVVLMSALIVAPATAARQWSHRLGPLTALAAGFGAFSGLAGTLLSHVLSEPGKAVPTGPTIVLVVTCVALLSILLAPPRGLLWKIRFRTPKLEAPK